MVDSVRTMQRSLAAGLALVIAAHAGGVRADPGAPQVDPIHLQREDAQRVREQQRELDRAPRAATAVPVPRPPIAADPPAHHDMRPVGVVLLGVAGVSAITTVSFAFAAAIPGPRQDTYETGEAIFLVTTAVAGLAGIVLIATGRSSSSSSFQLGPTATSTSVGLAISGRL
jgi:hypothetical protein